MSLNHEFLFGRSPPVRMTQFEVVHPPEGFCDCSARLPNFYVNFYDWVVPDHEANANLNTKDKNGLSL